MSEQERLRLKRSGGPGSPGTAQSEWMAKYLEKKKAADESKEKEKPEVTEEKKEEPKDQEKFHNVLSDAPLSVSEAESYFAGQKKQKAAEVQLKPAEKLYNIELIVYTVSGHKYSARLNFKDDVLRGNLSETDARMMIARTENDLRNRTFHRPITYSESKGAGSTEYIFNPENVECISITRFY